VQVQLALVARDHSARTAERISKRANILIQSLATHFYDEKHGYGENHQASKKTRLVKTSYKHCALVLLNRLKQ
jgi:hypothetical protein